MEPIISVVIPCYNCEKTIEETLNSLKVNKVSDFEVVLINDGSIDSTESIILKYVKQSTMRISYVFQKNEGVSSARNKGLAKCSGKYVTFLDADDMFAEHYIDFLVSVLRIYEYDVISCRRTTDLRKVKPINVKKNKTRKISPLNLLKKYTYSKKQLGICSFVFKKKICEKNNIHFTIGVKYGEDFEFITKYLANCNNAIFLCCYFYNRVLPTSASRTIRYEQVDAIKAAERSEAYLYKKQHSFANEFHKFMINKAVFSCIHRFCLAKRKDLLMELEREYDVKKALRGLVCNRKAGFITRISSILYFINKSMFYFVLSHF